MECKGKQKVPKKGHLLLNELFANQSISELEGFIFIVE